MRPKRAGGRKTLALAAGAGLLVPCALLGAVLAACTDGITPDCSDAATPCGPSLDAASDAREAQPLPETGPVDSAPDLDTSSPDAGDPDADASDGS